MAINLDAIGTVGEPVDRSWTSRDALLYALGVGAGYPDPGHELLFTTENSRDIEQEVVPTFGVALALGAGGVTRNIGKVNPAMIVHAEQAIELHRPITPEGSVTITSTLADIVDKRSGALVVTQSEAVDSDTGVAAFTTRSGMFIRGEGGFAAPTGDKSELPATTATGVPEREPDYEVELETLPHQALLYRLSGDRNPLHSDPKFAALAGFDRPILHGLCTYGFTCRALVAALCEGEPSRLTGMAGRFTKPVMPGQTLRVAIWRDGADAAIFQTSTNKGAIAVDRGRCTIR